MSSANKLRFHVEGSGGRDAEITSLVIAGWTGRDAVAMEEHIKELEAIGVPRPSTTPCFYRAAASLLTTAPSIEALGADSSGEAEFVIVALDDGLWIGAGSDHTDRKLETVGVAEAKQACAKPVAPSLWRYDDVAGHWDDLQLRSYAIDGAARVLYQEGPVTAMHTPRDLMARLESGGGWMAPGTLMFCGTIPAIGGIRPAGAFAFELHDPVLDRTISHEYAIVPLPVVR